MQLFGVSTQWWGFVGSCDNATFTFVRKPHLVFHSNCTILHSVQQHTSIPMSPYSHRHLSSRGFASNHNNGCQVVSTGTSLTSMHCSVWHERASHQEADLWWPVPGFGHWTAPGGAVPAASRGLGDPSPSSLPWEPVRRPRE